ncbi:MAG: chromosome segregation protein SMC [Deltaproteobacteria bacterium]|nr:chromosome segregation protein SMC [Deltaproteobacteria bacterium]
MYIKRIDLSGFKSFCDPMRVDLQQRLTGIVGPNGCGKSNIVDALRWAMGEQSARHLRGKQMEDVIFNGSDSRGPAGVAEISLTFENDGRVPPEYLSYEEITVTRRLHRDGTSEYLINRLPVRLRDVTNLFLGTGVGTKAYSIIEQGRVGLIVSAKPEDRRYFLEEAAGITKYRRRKAAAERKMDATRQNLLRVTDVLEEIEKRLGLLRRQAKKAERYKQYRGEMRDIELCSAAHQMLGITAERKVLDASLGEVDERRERMLGELERGEVELETARLQAAEQERALSALQERLYQLDNRIKLSESAREYQQHESADIAQRLERERSEVEEIERQIAELNEESADLQHKLESSVARREELMENLHLREAHLGQLREEADELEQALSTERDARRQADSDGARAEASLRALEQRRAESEVRLEQRSAETSRLVERLAELSHSATEIDLQLGDLRLSREQIEQRRQQARERLGLLDSQATRGEAELEVLRTELHRRRSRLASLEEIQQRYEGFGQGTRAVMQRLNGDARAKGVLGLVADIVEAPAVYETALEAVLEQRLGTIIVEDDHVSREAISFLKESAQGRTSFIASQGVRRPSMLADAPVGLVWDSRQSSAHEPRGNAPAMSMRAPSFLGGLKSSPGPSAGGGLQTIEAAGVHGPILGLVECRDEFRAVADSLLSDVVVVESLDRAFELADQMEKKTMVTLEGEILDASGTVTGGSFDGEMSGVFRQKREIKELSEIIVNLETQYNRALDAHVSVKAEISQLQHVLEEAVRDGHLEEKAIITHEKDLGRVQAERDAMAMRRQEIDNEVQQLYNGLDRLSTEQAQLERIVRETAETARVAGDVIGLLQQERGRLGERTAKAAHAVTEAKVAVAEAATMCKSVQEKRELLGLRLAERSERAERLRASLVDGANRVAELQRKAEEAEAELKQMVGERAAAQENLTKQRAECEAHLQQLGEREAALKELRATTSELGGALSELQIKASELRMRMEHLEQHVWERYREELRMVAGEYHLSPPVSEQQTQRLEQLRQLIDRMGEINLTAISEFEELNERFQFLCGHRDDLESALDQLSKAISRINRTCRKRFRETFEAVNAHFQRLFPRLFNGGRAQLVLTETDGDPLKGGVEIVAQPPGKKLQSLEMMSGGEKALTAVSMIFAMFMVKPTPFCLLDEVDAPLDEANVIRFRELIRDMSSQSQFIIITHNRRTMEIADTLYGVTMEEPGISRLVSVSLNQAEQVVGG